MMKKRAERADHKEVRRIVNDHADFSAEYYDCPFGRLLAVVDNSTGEVSYLLPEHLPNRFSHLPNMISTFDEEHRHPTLSSVRRWLDEYFAGGRPDPRELPLAPSKTPFQHVVRELMLRIPYGETVTYGEIAKEIAAERGIARMSAQAVGGAVGSNPVAIIIPCHRVIGADGSLVGYGGGTELLPIKKWLLAHEGAALS